jgi:hypothetical protein
MYGVYSPNIGSDSIVACETEADVLTLLNMLDDRRTIEPGELMVRDEVGFEHDAEEWLAMTE